ncbi:hypothetical protein DNTS_014253, partial [Danionella cerebrum]
MDRRRSAWRGADTSTDLHTEQRRTSSSTNSHPIFMTCKRSTAIITFSKAFVEKVSTRSAQAQPFVRDIPPGYHRLPDNGIMSRAHSLGGRLRRAPAR